MQELWKHSAPETTIFYDFKQQVSKKHNVQFGPETSDSSLYRWSVDNIDTFWSAVWAFTGVRASKPYNSVVDTDAPMFPRPSFFAGAKLNFAENLLYPSVDVDESDIAVISVNESNERSFTWKQLRIMVERCATGLSKYVGIGDVVAGYVGNNVESLVAMLACTSLGAAWTGISPDTGIKAVLERLQQLDPVVLFADSAVMYNGRVHGNLEKLLSIAKELPSLRKVVMNDIFGIVSAGGEDISSQLDSTLGERLILYTEMITRKNADTFPGYLQLDADHPVFVLFSSGTTGKPKCICHGAIGTLIQHKKEHQIHSGITKGSVFFQYTTVTWMMWHWLVTGLASGARIVLYDGSPFYPSVDGDKHLAIPSLLAKYKVTHFGTSAKYLSVLEQNNTVIDGKMSLQSLRAIFSTASPLASSTFHYVHRAFGKDVQLSSITGGTDIISLFGAPNPLLPVYPGLVQSPGLGMAIEVWSPDGQKVPDGTPGELVCVKSFPCMPVRFWNDPDNSKYRSSYFDTFDGVWRHGDFVRFVDGTKSLEMLGRSDGILNPAGIRFGSSEIYSLLLHHFPSEIEDSICVGKRLPNADENVVLFVKMHDGYEFSEDLIQRIKSAIKQDLSSRHVPHQIVETHDIPVTSNGKKVEVVVKNIINGTTVGVGASVANPECLEFYRDWVARN